MSEENYIPKEFLDYEVGEKVAGSIVMLLSEAPFGGLINNIYTQIHNNNERKRINAIFKNIYEAVDEVKENLADLNKKSEEQLNLNVEVIFDEVRKARSSKKINYFSNSFVSLISHCNQDNLDLDELCIQILMGLTNIEIKKLLRFYHKEKDKQPKDLEIDNALNEGIRNRLLNFGLIGKSVNTYYSNPITHYHLSNFGTIFCEYILGNDSPNY
ncbi:hypothetical protein [Tetragenococcus halophilus]|uniref:hypothetical protein n=1 Tax=Tetragenococcus halophilus TaxID=51669 RepID=UPI00077CD16B|nr:hypothetical protein [Tetragenococcus halophilus]GFK24867.1 hypothetical protein YA163_19300 [Tetragenococcus halophilus]